MRSNFQTLISRCAILQTTWILNNIISVKINLFSHLSLYRVLVDKEVDWHIHHKHMKEMSQKSITVSEKKMFVTAIIINVQAPLGVFPFNENKLDEMCQILDRLQVYCPKRMGNEDKECWSNDWHLDRRRSIDVCKSKNIKVVEIKPWWSEACP